MTLSRRTQGLALAAAAVAGIALWRHAQARAAERANPPMGRFVVVNGVRLHVLERGPRDAPAVLMLHGNGATVEDFDSSGLIDRLAERHRVVVIDRPGFGHTRRPRLRLFDASGQAALIADAMPILGLHRPLVLGHSWGALTAAALAVTRPETVSALALLSGYYFPTPRADVALFSLPAIPGPGDLFRYTVGPTLSAALEPLLLHRIYEPQPVPERFQREYPHPLAYRPSQIRAASEDTVLMIPSAAALAGRYREIAVPTLIMAGDEDRIVTFDEQSVPLHHEIAGSELHILPGLGHMIHHFAADEITAGVEGLFARLRGESDAPAFTARPPATDRVLHAHGVAEG